MHTAQLYFSNGLAARTSREKCCLCPLADLNRSIWRISLPGTHLVWPLYRDSSSLCFQWGKTRWGYRSILFQSMLLPLIAASLNDPAGYNYHCGVCQMGTFHFYHSFYLCYRMGFPISFIHSIIYIGMDAQCSTYIIASNPLLLLLCCSNYSNLAMAVGCLQCSLDMSVFQLYIHAFFVCYCSMSQALLYFLWAVLAICLFSIEL